MHIWHILYACVYIHKQHCNDVIFLCKSRKITSHVQIYAIPKHENIDIVPVHFMSMDYQLHFHPFEVDDGGCWWLGTGRSVARRDSGIHARFVYLVPPPSTIASLNCILFSHVLCMLLSLLVLHLLFVRIFRGGGSSSDCWTPP